MYIYNGAFCTAYPLKLPGKKPDIYMHRGNRSVFNQSLTRLPANQPYDSGRDIELPEVSKADRRVFVNNKSSSCLLLAIYFERRGPRVVGGREL